VNTWGATRRPTVRETLVIAKREFLERVRTKWFVVMTILGPILMVGMIVIPAVLAGRGSSGARVEIVDHTGKLGDALVAEFAKDSQQWKATVVPPDTKDAELLARVGDSTINGYIVIPADALDEGEIIYRGDNATNQIVAITLHQVITRVILFQRGGAAGMSEAQLAALVKSPNIKALHTTGKEEGTSGMETFLLGYIIAFLLYMVITLYGINVMRSVVTDKTSRVVELMVAATTPRAMMSGKIIGVGGAGLAQISIWLVIGGVALAYQGAILGALGIHDGGSAIPALTATQVAVVAGFFVFGYLFYSTMYAAVGATVSSEQDSQQAQLPITMFLVIGMVSMTAITGDPRGSTSATMTLVPFWSPMLMPLRYLLGGASASEVGLSLAILMVSSVLVARAAAKIYRTGILMYGKRPTFRELLHWLRY
jgi:ABC-2 type transport system permease protein